MRCPSCGTENTEPDSRFCPHCGGRMGTAQARVAPTVKIEDDARYPSVGTAYVPGPPSVQSGVQSGVRSGSVPLFPPAQVAAAAAPRTVSQPPVAAALGPAPAADMITRLERPSGKLAMPATAPRPAPITLEDSRPTRAGGRRWGLVAAILIVDLGLAGSGGFLLFRGLTQPVASTSQPKAP